MRWFRSNIRAGSRIALFALAVQLVLSFGHVHLLKSTASGLPLIGTSQSQPLAPPDAPAVPSKQKPSGLAHDFCAICSLIHLAGTLMPAGSPALLLPQVLARTWPQTSAEAGLPASRHVLFQGRAPPTV
jgi:hypothetical protein